MRRSAWRGMTAYTTSTTTITRVRCRAWRASDDWPEVYAVRMQAVEPPLVASGGTGRLRRIAPIACGCVLAGAAALVTISDPAAPGSHFPACQFRVLTGLWCPGCGLTRGFHQLFNGHPLSALQYNVFIPLVLVAVVATWWSWARSSWGRPGLRTPMWVRRATAFGLPVAVVAYGVARNIPVAPFTALAP